MKYIYASIYLPFLAVAGSCAASRLMGHGVPTLSYIGICTGVAVAVLGSLYLTVGAFRSAVSE
jgi:hypothetical protein